MDPHHLSVRLDHVLTGAFAVTPLERASETFDEFKIHGPGVAPAKKVTTHGEWTIPWIVAIKVYSFVFPHRQKELTEYGQQYFAAYPVLQHNRIFAFDATVRTRVASRRDLLLRTSRVSTTCASIGSLAPPRLFRQGEESNAGKEARDRKNRTPAHV